MFLHPVARQAKVLPQTPAADAPQVNETAAAALPPVSAAKPLTVQRPRLLARRRARDIRRATR